MAQILKKMKSQHSKGMIDDFSNRYLALSCQEGYYQCDDYFKLKSDAARKQTVDKTCRYAMTTWCFQVSDYFNASEETASIAMSYIDRFLSSNQGSFVLNNKNWFQLAVMTSLKLAIKVHESRSRLCAETLSQLSRGLFSAEDITVMERELLSALSWRLCPATPYVFLEFFIDLLPPSLPSTTRSLLLKASKKQIYLACPYFSFSLEKPSDVAFASLLNSMEDARCTLEHENSLRCCADLAGFKSSSESYHDLRTKLHSLLIPQNEIENKVVPCSQSRINGTRKKQQQEQLSPVSVRQAYR